MFSLTGKVALVTGGGSGIGRATCIKFAAYAAQVAVVDLNLEAAHRVVAEIEAAGGSAVAIAANVTNESQVKAMVARTLDCFGHLDCAFNSAGSPGPYKAIADLEEADWNQTIGINLTGTFLCMKAEIKAMLDGGGTIVNMASAGILMPAYPQPDYHAAKAGIIALTRSAAVAYGGRGIRVNVVLPGLVETPMLLAGLKRLGSSPEQAEINVPLKRIGRAEEIADTILWLSCNLTSYINGDQIVIDGGLNLN
jgi:NAD(P)-dependent dehydrogenase (short-subunit alcohol dehydrogenase family)